ncbi:MAG TPA: hypothetical protein VFQ45_10460 [Longimicrobium sp.]|nr:hypothetical protein [Longimicrobium sp.]
MPPDIIPPAQALSDARAEDSNALVLNFLTLRKAVGYIGLALPFALVAGENLRDRLLSDAGRMGVLLESSISAYFHTGMREVFVGSLCAIGVFLLAYRGYDRRDRVLSNIAGVCALLVALFPTFEASREASDTATRAPDSVTFFSGADAPDPHVVGYVHFAAAAAFFALLAWISLVQFTKSDTSAPTREKRERNIIYRLCGWVILGCIAAIAVAKLLLDDAAERSSHFVFWFEAIAVVAFGISWLVKGEAIAGVND